MLAEQAGLDLGTELTGPRGAEITRRYVRAFLDLHLRGRPTAFLDAPSPDCPEVHRCEPAAGADFVAAAAG
ncbi:hypothetical protein [Actinoplanes derwentensis]|uniref:hypothetical protein n=1 Tax=Actinoplanes derwentensis TaxID=113562 RepID=UPI001A62F85B|nr:hypothetical protein [Actinoplanes derwentensis]GID89769.1 hypothetical protein Ade03nite_86930 [Actinoplanes derwentensis]